MTDNQIGWLRGRVVSNVPAAEGIARIEIVTDRPHHAPPGAHLDIRLPDNDTRSYSIVHGSPDGTSVTLGVRRSPTSRGGSHYMHGLRAGDEVEITAPLQNFPLRVGAQRYVLLAGGIGITAMAGMAAVLARLGAEYEIHYVGRSRRVMAFLDELQVLHGDRITVYANDEGAYLDVADIVDDLDESAELYMCGPIRLMDDTRRRWLARRLPLANLRYETFGNSGWFDPEPFDVAIPSLDFRTTVGTSETLLGALERAGLDVMSDCRRGECGLCELSVVEVSGRIDHRDVFYSEKQKTEAQRLCACVSRVVGGGSTPILTLEKP
ncbi:PDR/VanB family oxidoreductase [Gordonia sp. L191]|uniref:PDR/VanB family oxidoreductase n=1 Tax=Gordonia sp. L191 TaxID=2982699 RepID=UPI0024BF494D|nr:PDR/VanB family oxidoreductase [Gordonia sp. L191]WHU45674.1 PDR/VanB family oxidoreductase [Gordonia sp. L191]